MLWIKSEDIYRFHCHYRINDRESSDGSLSVNLQQSLEISPVCIQRKRWGCEIKNSPADKHKNLQRKQQRHHNNTTACYCNSGGGMRELLLIKRWITNKSGIKIRIHTVLQHVLFFTECFLMQYDRTCCLFIFFPLLFLSSDWHIRFQT